MNIVDNYPSRTGAGEKTEILERQDPVVFGDLHAAGDPPLTGAQIDYYDKNGFLFFPGFFSDDEIRSFQEELNSLRADPRIKNNEEVFLEPQSAEVRSIFNIHRNNPLFRKLCRNPRILSIVQLLLGSQVYIHQSRINYKPGFAGKEFYWHSDFETWHVEDGMPYMRAVSCSITLSENNEFNGPLMLIPGSHRYFIACGGETPENHYKKSLRKQEYGVPDPEALNFLVKQGGMFSTKGPAGSLVLFECNIMHGSNSNISPWPRSNVFFVYNSVENSLVEPFCGLQPRPEYIGSRDFTPLTPDE